MRQELQTAHQSERDAQRASQVTAESAAEALRIEALRSFEARAALAEAHGQAEALARQRELSLHTAQSALQDWTASPGARLISSSAAISSAAVKRTARSQRVMSPHPPAAFPLPPRTPTSANAAYGQAYNEGFLLASRAAAASAAAVTAAPPGYAPGSPPGPGVTTSNGRSPGSVPHTHHWLQQVDSVTRRALLDTDPATSKHSGVPASPVVW